MSDDTPGLHMSVPTVLKQLLSI